MMNEKEDVTPAGSRPAVEDAAISARTLQMIDEAAQNYRDGVVGPPIAPELLARLVSS